MSFNIYNQLTYMALLSIVFCFTSSAQDKFYLVAQPDVRQNLLKYAQICSKQTGVPAAALQLIMDWPMPDDRPSKEFFQCVCFNTGYTGKDGHFIVDAFLDLVIVNGTKEEIAKTLNDCNQVTLDDPLDTAYAMGDCAHKYLMFGLEK